MTWKKWIMSIALCLCALLCAASVRAEAADTHNHLVCGGTTCTTCTHKGDAHTTGVTWTAWDGGDITYDTNNEAHIYLSSDVTLKDASPLTVSEGKTLYLCLNGNSIKMKYDGGYWVIWIDGGNLVLCDCKGRGTVTQDTSNTSKDRGVKVSSGTFTMYGGSITGNNGGVEVQSNCTFTLYGGKITENELKSSNEALGGGVRVANKGKFYMYGGEVSKNRVIHTDDSTDASGGGVYNFGTFTMSGGEITNNTAKGNGGGVYNNSKFTMSGGSITINTATNNGGGVYNGGTFEISDDITIADNKKIDSDNKSTANNVCLSSSYRAITIAGELGKDVSIGVTTAASLSDNDYIDITKENYNTTLVNAAKSKFTYTDENGKSHEIVTREGGKILAVCKHSSYETKWTSDETNHWHKCQSCDTKKDEAQHGIFWTPASCAAPKTCSKCGKTDGAALQHPVCGLTCTHEDSSGSSTHDPVPWTGWSGGDITYDVNGVARISLSDNVTLTSPLEVSANQTLYLCLNGHSITMQGGYRVIDIDGGELFLCNCKDTGAITHSTTGTKGMGVCLAVKNSKPGKFTMYGGNITGNTVGVSVDSGCTFTMYGGSITNNTAPDGENGGGVKNSGEFTMYNGTISGNKTINNNGGGVYVDLNATFTMHNGTISNNTAGNDGGGVYNEGSGKFTMSGGEISGNSSGNFAGGVRNFGTFTMSGGSITGNTSANNGGGVNGSLTVSGDVIIEGNKKGNEPNNVYLPTNSTITLAGALGKDASIHVTTPSAPSSGSYVNITAPNSNKDLVTAAKDKFVYDNSSSSNPIQICTYTVTEGETTTVQLRACKHNYDNTTWTANENASTHSGKCANCDTIKSVAHEYNKQNTADEYQKSAATCTAKAVYYKSCVCGATDTSTAETFESGNPLGHSGGEATCTAQAVCEVCHQSYGNLKAHDFENGTYQYDGQQHWKKCANCDATTESVAHTDFAAWKSDSSGHWHECSTCGYKTAVAAHTPDRDAPTETAAKVCKDCDWVIAPATHPEHTWVFVAETPATCNATGVKEHYNCTCGRTSFKNGDVYNINADAEVLTIEKNPANHTGAPGSEWHSDSAEHWNVYTCCGAKANVAAHTWQPATCTTPKTCSTCHATEGAALGHTWVNATCTTPKTCSACYVTDGAALGHDWSAWVVTTPATKDAPGVETRTCAHDKTHTQTRAITKLSTAVYTVSEDTEITQIEAKVDGLDKILDSEENKKLANDGKSVGISLTVKNTASSGVSEKIKEKLAGSNLVGLRLELTVERTVTANGAVVERENIPDTVELLKTTITLPAELQGKSGYVVYRLHGENVDVLTETANNYGEYISVSADKTQITICARLYSEYVVAYRTSGSSGGGYHPAASTPVKATSANTGDAGVLLYGVTAALSLTGTAWLGTKSKKR